MSSGHSCLQRPCHVESIVGDITPHDPMSKTEKAQREAAAMARIRGMLGDALGGAEMEALFLEYEAGETEEAKMLKVSRGANKRTKPPPHAASHNNVKKGF